MSDETDPLRKRWQASVQCLIHELCSSSSQTSAAGIDHKKQQTLDEQSLIWLENVAKLYAEPHRAYHNMTHVQDVIASLDFLLDGTDSPIDAQTTNDEAILILAAFFHDVIYNPKSSTNEKDSADLFLQFANELFTIIATSQNPRKGSISENDSGKCKMVMQIEECIIATATHISSAETAHKNRNQILAIFLDADMSILGKDVDIYNKYAGCIRREYEFVDRNMYCDKRADILESFLPLMNEAEAKQISATSAALEKKHSFIYATEKARTRWEEQARENLRNEIEMLRSGVIPCEILQ